MFLWNDHVKQLANKLTGPITKVSCEYQLFQIQKASANQEASCRMSAMEAWIIACF